MATEPMWDLGRRRRLARIVRPATGRAVVVALDHGLFIGPLPQLESVPAAVRGVVAGRPDAVQLTPGATLAAGEAFCGSDRPAMILRLDATNLWRSKPKPHPAYHARVATPLEAVRLGADAAVCFLFVGYEDDTVERDNLERVANWAAECRGLGMPLIVEPLAITPSGGAVRDPDVVRLLVRMAWEAGADIIKADYTGDPESFRTVVESVPVPVLVRGGPRMDGVADSLRVVADSLAVGAAGVVFGRNIWQQPDPAAMVRAIDHLCHGGGDLDGAVRLAAGQGS